MTTTLCAGCAAGPSGEFGHDAFVFYVQGPYPGHNIFKCALCSERWIRHYGSTAQPFAWTRYSEQFKTRTPRADPVRPKESA